MGDGAYDADVAAEIGSIAMDFDSAQAIEDREAARADRYGLYLIAKSAKVGADVRCPSCKAHFKKKSHQQAFCSNKGDGNCKDFYWNGSTDERTMSALEHAK